MTDLAWIDAALTGARAQALGALLRYFRDLDTAEEAFQDACLRALKSWPENGPPRDPAAWLIMVGRNVAIDAVRRRSKQAPLPAEELISDLDDAEAALTQRLDGEHYRDDILRLLFICCHPELPATQQIALALRIVSGLSVRQIARAFLVGESAMEQRITRAKARIAGAGVPFEAPGAVERAERLAAVTAMIYLVFNEGYSAGQAEDDRAGLCDEAIRLARLLLRLFPGEPEIMGLTALLLLQHARAAARFDASGEIVLLEDQDRSCWNGAMIAEGLALLDKAIRLARLLLRLFPGEPEIMGLTALLLLQHARAAARFDASGEIVVLEDQDRGKWNGPMIAEGLALLDKAIRHRRRGPYQIQAAIAALHARAASPADTDWAQIDLLYAALETLQPSPVVTLNRAVATAKTAGPEAALAMIEPLAERLHGYFHFFGLKGHLLMQLGRAAEARIAFNQAIALANSAPEAAHIRRHLDRLIADAAPASGERR